MEYVGIQTQKSRNDFRSMLLLFMFPCLVTGMVYLFCLALAWLGLIGSLLPRSRVARPDGRHHGGRGSGRRKSMVSCQLRVPAIGTLCLRGRLDMVHYSIFFQHSDNQGVHGSKVTGEKGRQTCLQPGREPLHEPGYENAEDKHQ